MDNSIQELREFIRVAKGDRPADLVLTNCRLVNVLSGEIHEADLAIFEGRIAGLGAYQGKAEMDLGGHYVAPGFIDSHVHIESSKLLPREYARAIVPKGTTAAVMDPHEIANVLGLQGIRFMLCSSHGLPLSVYLMLSSCVPTTELETSGALLSASDLDLLLGEQRVLGIAELMNYPGLLAGEREVLEKINLGRGKRVDGHAPGLTGKGLCAYVGSGIRSDHECTTRNEAKEKLRLGMIVMIREGSTAKNLEELIPLVRPETSWRFLLATDDRSPEDLEEEGHLDFLICKAVSLGLNPIIAIQMATINAASYFKIDGIGAIAPGFQADLVVLEDLRNFRVLKVFKDGELVAEKGEMLSSKERPQEHIIDSPMKIDWSGLSRLSVSAEREQIRVMELIAGQILNRSTVVKAKTEGDLVVSDVERDILKLAVIERHRASGNVGVGFVRGFGLKAGALGSSVAHDSHNIIVVGASDADIKAAAYEVAKMGGGQVVVRGCKTLAALPLPIAGLMSDRPLADVVTKARALKDAAADLGCRLSDPFMSLSFLALPVIPELRVTDRGVVDVRKFGFVSLFAEA